MSNLAKRAYGTVFKAIQRYDLSEWDCKPECDTPIYGVYHVFCDKGWQELVADQIRRLKDSGLYSAPSACTSAASSRTRHRPTN